MSDKRNFTDLIVQFMAKAPNTCNFFFL